MKARWLNLILRLTNKIYQKKQTTLETQDFKSIGRLFSIIFLEITLAVVSFPLYLVTNAEKSSAYLAEKGGHKKIAVDYKLRKVLTLTGVGLILIVWIIKLLIIILTPTIVGPLNSYEITDVEPVTIEVQEAALLDTDIQTAKVVPGLVVPKIETLDMASRNEYVFKGTGTPGASVVLFLTDLQAVMYRTEVSQSGDWTIEHSQKDFKLQEGIHPMFAFHYMEDNGTRSSISSNQYFRVKTSVMDRVMANFDNLANWALVIIIIWGVFLTVLTI